MRDSIVGDKSFKFAVKIVNLYKDILQTKNEYVLSKQLLRAGTSIGANIREALDAQSKKDFISKISIALKEAVETEYWIELLRETDYIKADDAKEFLSEVNELVKMLTKIIKTSKLNKDIEK